MFVINATNAAVAIPQLQHRSSVIQEVQASVAAGKEVTIHESPITANGWSGAGYSVVDPETGAGGYLIEGGARGGFLDLAASALGAIAKIAVSAWIIGFLAPLVASVIALPVLVGMYVMLFAVFAAFIVALLANAYDEPNKDDDFYKRLMDSLTWLPSLGSQAGIIFAFARLLWSVR